MKVKIAQNEQDLQKIFQLRYEVLRKPWKQPFETSFDELDKISINAFIENNDICIACGRLDILQGNTAQIRYMAVHPDFRNIGLGKQILSILEEIAFSKGIEKIILHARENALIFYLKHKYKLIKPSHILFNTIQHYLMEKEIKKLRK